METLRCVLMSVCLVCVTAAPSSEENKADGKRDNRGLCYTSEGVFSHGQIVATRRSPCLKYRCEFGRLRILEVSCPSDNSCHRVGTVWRARDCHTYTCSRMSYNSYRIDRLESGCTDAYGTCRRAGDTFPYPVNGRIYNQCTCQTTPDVIKYSCNYPGTYWDRQFQQGRQRQQQGRQEK